MPGIKVLAVYGAYVEHKLFYIVETDNYESLDAFLKPGRKRCRVRVTPVDRFL